MPKIANKEGLEDMCRWHMNGSHTTYQCQVFRGVLTRQLNLKKLVVSEIEHWAMKFEVYRTSLAKAKVRANATKNPSLAVPEEKSKTYKEAAQKFPLQTRAIEGLKALRGGMRSSCSDKLTFEMIITQVIPNDPTYVPAY